MYILFGVSALILLPLVFVKIVYQGSAACRSVLGRLVHRAVQPGYRFRIPYIWSIHAYPACWFSTAMPLESSRTDTSSLSPSSCSVRWWISDAYIFGQAHIHTMPVAMKQVTQRAVAATLGAATLELNLLQYIGEAAISAELSDWLSRHPDACRSFGQDDADAEALISLISPLLHERCGVRIDQLRFHWSQN
jgi:hypothetical protein